MFDSVLVANRGEIARRVIRTLRRLGVRAVAIHTDADAGAPHVQEADAAVRVASYLDVGAVVAAAAGADAVHPGYGFLAEDPAFARACAAAGLVFVGPSAAAIELVGDKVRAKAAAQAAGVPVLASYTLEQARTATEDYPLLVKAAAGGGGRGLRVVRAADQLDAAVAAARREVRAGFGDPTALRSEGVFAERYLERARHIEVQVMGTVSLGERECSLQRRHQKLVEEAPSPVVTPELRARLGEEAVALVRAAGYENAGTVEFLCDADDPAVHHFLEMNARLQVEHPVTELVTGLDLVECQLRVAAGEPLGFDAVELRGHAIEARVNAEDVPAGFLPAAGTVLEYRRAALARTDAAIERGSVVGTDYDSLLAKVIVHGHDRPTALAGLDLALAETVVLGVSTNTGFLRGLLATDEVREGALDTGLVERLVATPAPAADGARESGLAGAPAPAADALAPVAAPFGPAEVARQAARIELAATASSGDDPFARTDGWRLGGVRAPSWWRVSVEGGEAIEVELAPGEAVDPGWAHARDGDTLWLGRDGHAWRVRRPAVEETRAAAVEGDLRAPMPGSVLLVAVAEGDAVRAGDPVVVLESMKMELAITAPANGVVAEISVAVGDRVKQGQPLARVE